MHAIVFPGQGSQEIGMGKAIYETFPQAKSVFEEVDEALGQKLSALMFDGTIEELTLTQNAQPALMAVSMAVVKVLESHGYPLAEKFSYAAGHSLGEYSALCAAGALSLSDTARLLRIRGNAMQQAVPVGVGAMAAVIGLDFADVAKVVDELTTDHGVCMIANDNSPGQVVISGNLQAVEHAVGAVTAQGAKKCVMLPVSAPFHCSLMQPAADRMAEALDTVQIHQPMIPIIMNVTSEETMDPQKIKQLLIAQVTGRVRWRESMLKLKTLGVHKVLEVGSGKVLTGLLKRIDREMEGRALNTPQEIEEFLKEE